MKLSKVNRRILLFLSMVFFLATSCTSVRLISEYDEITDKAVTSLQEKTARFLIKLDSEIGTEQGKYENNKQVYQDLKVDLNTLKVRADAIDKNEVIIKSINELNSMVLNLEKLHKMGFASTSQIEALQQPFNTAFSAIIRLQLALKRGEKKSSNK